MGTSAERRGEREQGHTRRRGARPRSGVALALLSALLSGIWLFAGGIPSAHASGDGAIAILVPTPDATSNAAGGPVGTNVTIKLAGTPGDTYKLGIATNDTQCVDGFQALDKQPVTLDTSGATNVRFIWPAAAGNVGTSYYICANDVTNSAATPIQSDQTFVTAGTTPPQITLAVGPAPTNTTGTPAVPGDAFYPGSAVTITGQGFVPATNNLIVYLTHTKFTTLAEWTPDKKLATADGSPIQSDASGAFTATVNLPQSLTPGGYYLYVATGDGLPDFLPALVAVSSKFNVKAVPTPVPTPTVKTTTSAGTGGNSTTPPKPIAAIVGLASLSILLFIIGVILLASAATSAPRPGHQ
jgi:hypothetical protein